MLTGIRAPNSTARRAVLQGSRGGAPPAKTVRRIDTLSKKQGQLWGEHRGGVGMPQGRAAPLVADIEALLRQARWLDAFYASMRLAVDPSADVNQRAVALALGAWATASSGDSKLAEYIARLAVEVGEASSDPAIRARTVAQLGITQIWAEHAEAAESTLRAFLAVGDRSAAPEWTARALQGLGYLRSLVPDRLDAVHYYEAALAALDGVGADLDALRMELHLNLAQQFAKSANALRARQHLDAIAALNPGGTASAWRHMVIAVTSAAVARAEGHTDQAESEALGALRQARTTGNKHVTLDSLEVLMGVAKDRGDHKALERLQHAYQAVRHGILAPTEVSLNGE